MFLFCCTFIYVHSSIAIILMGESELVVLLNLSSWSLMMVERLFLLVPWGCLWFVIVVFPDHTHLLFLVGFPAQSIANSLLTASCQKRSPIIIIQEVLLNDDDYYHGPLMFDLTSQLGKRQRSGIDTIKYHTLSIPNQTIFCGLNLINL